MDYLKRFSLEGKNALVTGASSEQGLCCGMAKALNGAGAKVAMLDISDRVHTLVESLGGEKAGFYSVQGDLTDASSREDAFEKVLQIFDDKLDILLNGAGIQFRKEAIDFPEDAWNRVVSINLNATFFLSQLAARNMINNGKGKIINIASLTSFVASRNIPAYSASKGGVMQLTKALSNEWCSLGVNVNAIAPGYMITELTKDLVETDLGKSYTARIPAGRWGISEDLMGPVVFLASEASDYMSGVTIPVDGGFLGF
jgi:Dehydrogenases with different specificities (related to short-chain alcohol dehydrogenases)